MIFIITVFRIIISYYIYCFRIFCLIRHYHSGQCTGNRTRSIYRTYTGSQTLCNLTDTHGIRRIRLVSSEHRLVNGCAIQHRMRIRVIRIVYLIADTPQEYTRVIPVTTHHIRHIAFNPFFKEIKRAVIAWLTYIPSLYPFPFREFPFIRSLIHHQEPHSVT